MTMHMLLIESNDLTQSESLLPNLEQTGCQVCVVHTPSTAATKINTIWPDLVVFNLLNIRPDPSAYHEAISGTDLNIPYLIVGRGEDFPVEADVKVLVKSPSDAQQLARAIQKAISKQSDRFIRFPNLTIDCEQNQILRDGETYSLTPKEFKLLHLLVTNAGQVSSRKSIMQQVWETDYLGDTRTLDVHIRWLREKIEQDPSRPRHLITVRGVGYHFVAEPEDNSS